VREDLTTPRRAKLFDFYFFFPFFCYPRYLEDLGASGVRPCPTRKGDDSLLLFVVSLLLVLSRSANNKLAKTETWKNPWNRKRKKEKEKKKNPVRDLTQLPLRRLWVYFISAKLLLVCPPLQNRVTPDGHHGRYISTTITTSGCRAPLVLTTAR
jgi:hypothetical protein